MNIKGVIRPIQIQLFVMLPLLPTIRGSRESAIIEQFRHKLASHIVVGIRESIPLPEKCIFVYTLDEYVRGRYIGEPIQFAFPIYLDKKNDGVLDNLVKSLSSTLASVINNEEQSPGSFDMIAISIDRKNDGVTYFYNHLTDRREKKTSMEWSFSVTLTLLESLALGKYCDELESTLNGLFVQNQ